MTIYDFIFFITSVWCDIYIFYLFVITFLVIQLDIELRRDLWVLSSLEDSSFGIIETYRVYYVLKNFADLFYSKKAYPS